MEQNIKISVESLRYGDVVNEDRISELPEDLLVKILSSLPTENVVAASVLSKRWRSLWKMVPYLKFTAYHNTEDRFSNIVCTSLLSLKAPVLESLHVEASERSGSWDLGIWIGIAFARHVRELVLDFHSEGNMIRIPNVVCTYNSTLETLKLKNCIYLHFPSPVCFESLKKLHLNLVEFQDEESVCNLLSGCPSLQDLFMKQKVNTDVATFTIAVPSLQRLTIEEDCYPGEGFGGYVINAPSLKYLNIIGFKGLEFCLIETAPKLVEAKIINVSNISNENILVSQTSARRLSLHLSPLEIKYPTGIIFYQLVYLELCTRKRKWWNLLSLMLDSSPKLQILKLMDPFWYGRRACPVGWEWEQPKRVPECLLFHLETFAWIRYDWNREDEKEVATYILKNARRLKKATFSTKTINSEEHEKLEKRCEMLTELASVVRASTSCDVMFESE